MGKNFTAVDGYIAKSADFAKPILKHLRKVIRSACPDVEEQLKWNCPHFMHQGMLCSIAAFKTHCTFGFWKSSLLAQKYAELGEARHDAMGQFGRITKLADLPNEKTLKRIIKDAMALNEEGIKPPKRATSKARAPLNVPGEFTAALQQNKKAQAAFDDFSPSCQREYIEWIAEAKRAETRERRMAQAIAWMAAGKSRNWKYQKK
jgi:uncharacterized protein YdeI (YjbR/CyaY-like superfamily)